MPARFELAAWRAPSSPTPLLAATETILGAVVGNGTIDPRRWGQRVRHHGDAKVFEQLWALAEGWPTSSRIYLYASFLQHRVVRLSPAVIAGTAADLTAAMIRTPDRADSDHIRYIVNGCVERHLHRLQVTRDVYASTYLAIWDRLSDEAFNAQGELLLWRVIARTVQRAPRYWPAGTRAAMMASIWAAVLDKVPLSPVLSSALFLVATWSEAEDVPRVSRVVQTLATQFQEYTSDRPLWRLVFEDALQDGPWPAGVPRLSDEARMRANDELWDLPTVSHADQFDLDAFE